MLPPPHAPRPRCERCLRPRSTCLCAWRRPTANEVDVLLLQHPAETRHAKGSARLLLLSLQQCHDQIGEVFDAAALQAWLQGPGHDGWPRQPWLLFPAGPGISAEPPPAAADLRLVVLDGSWRQARQLLARHPALQLLPRWSLASPPPSRYTIRKAQRPEQRSTLEATCLALAALEGNAPRYEPLLAAFDGWVAAEDRRRSLTP